MKMLAALCAGLILAVAGARAQPKPLPDLLDPIRTKHKLPALGGAIVTTDGLAAIGVCGVRRAGHDEAVTDNDLWHLGSCTKAMTATLVARLVERGTLKWMTTLGQGLPDMNMDPGWRDVTLEQLLCNRGGAPSGLERDGLWGRLWRFRGAPTEARRLLTEGVLNHPPEYEPGSKFLYSNSNFAIAGYMAEAATGTAWEDLMRREVFGPLGITSAGFGAPGNPVSGDSGADQPRGHSAGVPLEPGPFSRSDNPVAIGPAGIVHMSLADWSRFVTAHLRGAAGLEVRAADGTPFLTPESWTKLHTPPAGGYAMGWSVATRPWAKGNQEGDTGLVLTHSGSNTMWYCVTWLAPERGFAVLVTTNTAADGGRATDEAASGLIRYWLNRRPDRP
ncbi:MAG: serine hydrolase [Phycisphaerales bacterium]|nr:serine hydrolase [Phycisphaerales bacterium]